MTPVNDLNEPQDTLPMCDYDCLNTNFQGIWDGHYFMRLHDKQKDNMWESVFRKVTPFYVFAN